VVKTVKQGFETLKQNLEITDLQATTVSTRQQNVRESIAAEMNILDSFLAGSYKRNTMIAPLYESDIDIFVILHPDYYKSDGQAFLLDKVKTVLKKTYPKTPEISRNGQAVTITFNDFMVDVVPTFNRQGGGYLIPDSIQKRWISTDPSKHTEIWSAENKSHNGDLIPLIKMMKGWNKENNAVLRSFHLESLIIKILKDIKIADFKSGVRYLLYHLRGQVQYPLPDPAGYDDNLASYLDSQDKIRRAINGIESAYQKAVRAEQLEERGEVVEAISKWKEIFGTYFPAYG